MDKLTLSKAMMIPINNKSRIIFNNKYIDILRLEVDLFKVTSESLLKKFQGLEISAIYIDEIGEITREFLNSPCPLFKGLKK